MKILAVSYDVPQPDKSSGELRFFSLLQFLSANNEVVFYARDEKTEAGPEAHSRLTDCGIRIAGGRFDRLLRDSPFDVVLFEFYFVAEPLIDLVRIWQPKARVVVDSVDVHFNRLRSKARVTGLASDADQAEAVRESEMSVYGRADATVVVSADDAAVLEAEGHRGHMAIIPNIHVMHPLADKPANKRPTLVFVGSYKWEPNIDAMLHFCSEVLPMVIPKCPDVLLRVIGSAPTPEILALASDHVDVLGYVPDTTPYLMSSDISIAPLRFGGGIKGKIGEAMAAGLPVLTTSIGAEGFGFRDRVHAVVADSPSAFAEAVVELAQDQPMRDRIRTAGWAFIRDRFSPEAVGGLLTGLLRDLADAPPKRLPLARIAAARVPYLLDRHVLWRFRRTSP